MSNSMQGYIDPISLAKKHQSLRGTIPLLDMPRACEELEDTQGDLHYNLDFSLDPEGRCLVSGELQVNLAFLCQRCLKVFRQDLRADFTLSPVLNDEQAKLLASEYEPVIMTDGKLDPVELLEDELILALPIAAKHAVDECANQPDTENAQARTNPFRALQDLKLNKNVQIGDKNGGTTES